MAADSASALRPVFVLDYVRTPRGKGSSRGGLHDVSPVELMVGLHHALTSRSNLDPGRVEDILLGCASQVDEQGANLARTAALMAGWPSSVPGATLNRFCTSGLDAVALTAARINSGAMDLAIAGGVESVSRVPMYADRGPLWTDPSTVARIGSIHMGVAADLNATVDGFGRAQLDEYGLETQVKAGRAWAAGFYGRSVVPVRTADGSVVDRDELLRPATTAASLAALPPAFAELGAAGQDELVRSAHPELGSIRHEHTVGTSPALADAAALIVLGSAEAAAVAGLRPRARILGSATTATDPVIMLTAGQSAAEQVLARHGLRPADIDVFEFAEAFAALCLRFRRDLDAGPDRLNPNGGTIAMGHAFGATGAILLGQCIDELENRGGRYGIAAVSGAAGLGVAVLVDRCS